MPIRGTLVSFVTRQADRRGIHLLEPSVLYALDHHQLETLCSKFHEIETMARRMMGLGLVQLQAKLDDLSFASALQRYQTLVDKNPGIAERVPLGMLASYIGITQETLSRVRSQFWKF